LRLAKESSDAFVRAALTELASELHGMAEIAETREVHRRQPNVSWREPRSSSG
jgi:hypothetical protein